MKHSSLNFILVLDVGTTSIKACLFDEDLHLICKEGASTKTEEPKRGWVEQDPMDLFKKSKQVLERVVKQSGISPKRLIGLGITNQRETTIVWNKKTGKPIYPAIVWKDTRTEQFCRTLIRHSRKNGNPAFLNYVGSPIKVGDDVRKFIREKTGLFLDTYFSASKIQWILQYIPEAKHLLLQEQLCFGTVDSWILWNFCEGNPHLTDETNASRTLLFDIKKKQWSDDLCELFSVPETLLPRVQFSKSFFGNLKKDLFGFSLPVLAICGDQQASMYAAGTHRGTTKVTFGTGTFLAQSLGNRFDLFDGYQTTLITGEKKSFYGVEIKISCYGKDIEPYVNDSVALRRVLLRFAKEVKKAIHHLPIKTKAITIDGGGTRDGILKELLQQELALPIYTHDIFDGTALGIAKMIFSIH